MDKADYSLVFFEVKHTDKKIAVTREQLIVLIREGKSSISYVSITCWSFR
jgi:hypothetical protein